MLFMPRLSEEPCGTDRAFRYIDLVAHPTFVSLDVFESESFGAIAGRIDDERGWVSADLEFERYLPREDEMRKSEHSQRARHLAELAEPDQRVFLLAQAPRRRLTKTRLARELGISRSALYRRLASIEGQLDAAPPVQRLCVSADCTRRLPSGSTRRRRFCSVACRVREHRRIRQPEHRTDGMPVSPTASLGTGR